MTRGSHYIHPFMVLNILYQLSYNTQQKLIIRHRKCKYLAHQANIKNKKALCYRHMLDIYNIREVYL